MANEIPFELPLSRLVGFSSEDGTYHGIPSYAAQLAQLTVQHQTSLEASSSSFKCTALALAFLGLLAAGGSAALIVLSHGPYSNLPFFVSGVVLGAASSGLLVPIPITYHFSSKTRTELTAALQQEEKALIPLNDILPHMAQAEPQRIEYVVKGLTKSKQKRFISQTHREYFGRGKPALDDGQKNVINAFTTCDEATLIGVIQDKDAAFAGDLLKTVDRTRLTAPVIRALFEAVGEPQDAIEADLLASFPDALKACKRRPIFLGVLQHANPALNPGLMAEIMSDPRSEDEAVSILRHEAALKMKLTPDPAGRSFALAVLQFAPANQDTVLANDLFKAVGKPVILLEAQHLARHPQALLHNMENGDLLASFPEIVAGLAQNHPLIFNPDMLALIFPAMDRKQKTVFLNLMAEANKDPSKSGVATDAVAFLIPLLV